MKAKGFTLTEVLVVAAILGIAAIMVASAIYGIGRNEIPDYGIVVCKKFTPAHTNHIYHYAGRDHLEAIPQYVPDEYGVVIQADGTTGDDSRFYVKIDKRRYDRLAAGDRWERVALGAEK